MLAVFVKGSCINDFRKAFSLENYSDVVNNIAQYNVSQLSKFACHIVS